MEAVIAFVVGLFILLTLLSILKVILKLIPGVKDKPWLEYLPDMEVSGSMGKSSKSSSSSSEGSDNAKFGGGQSGGGGASGQW